MKSCRAKCTINIQSWILEVVSQVPLYISTCCDQLWHNHSVVCVDSPTQILTSISVIRRVDDIAWVCKTCYNHLVKNRIPPYAVVNGLAFPQKPAFGISMN